MSTIPQRFIGRSGWRARAVQSSAVWKTAKSGVGRRARLCQILLKEMIELVLLWVHATLAAVLVAKDAGCNAKVLGQGCCARAHAAGLGLGTT